MKQTRLQLFSLVLALAVMMLIGGCAKKKTPPPPPPPPPPAPTASISANPSSIEKGQSTQLTWRTENSTDVSIAGIGKVDPSGSQSVSPTESTTYRLSATGAGGTQEATTRVTVAAPPPPPPPQQPSLTDEQMFAQNVRDAFFEYDKYDVRADAQQALQADAAFLKQHPNMNITIEGHCDERGSTEYNLSLGTSRAESAKSALVAAGVEAGRIQTQTFGKEKPFCTDANEECWQQNRRAHLVLRK